MAVTLKGSSSELCGLSTDPKPTDAPVNQVFHELDSDEYFYFDGTEWKKCIDYLEGSKTIILDGSITCTDDGNGNITITEVDSNE